jgi:hypothetical protein
MNRLENFTKGWLVGDFVPSLFQSKDIEIGIKKYNKDDFELNHVHNIVKEYTVILTGKVLMNNKVYSSGDIIIIEPKQYTDFKCLEESITLVIKTPSIPSDKHL